MTINTHHTRWMTLLTLSLAMTLAACGEPAEDTTPQQTPDVDEELFDDDMPPLENLQTLIGDHPETNGKTLTRYDEKFDITLPPRFDLVETQTPVRNQASRGVCSVFATVGLVEHLYIKAGMQNPDFSEQYLQWSAKFEIGSFPNSGGSSNSFNLDAVTRFGVVEESVWPYETKGWGAAEDPKCTGKEEEQPTYCHTNGEPSEEVRNAPKFKLPKKDFVSSFPDSIKTYMFQNKRAVAAGMSFYYQSWSHGGSKLKANPENRLAGAVVFPSDADQADSEARPAGHAFLLVGWDDELQFPRMAEDGSPLTDAQGNIVYDKGFFLFKNSWGSGGAWGSKNTFGPGYGWLSYRYMQRWGRANSATEPKLEAPREICGDGIDNSGNGLTDCADPACAREAICTPMASIQTFTSTPAAAIPDNDFTGISDAITVEMDGIVKSLKVTVDITHTYKGDLDLILESPNGKIAILLESDGQPGRNLNETFFLPELADQPAKGDWKLYVSDQSRLDTGVLNSWSIEIGN